MCSTVAAARYLFSLIAVTRIGLEFSVRTVREDTRVEAHGHPGNKSQWLVENITSILWTSRVLQIKNITSSKITCFSTRYLCTSSPKLSCLTFRRFCAPKGEKKEC